MYIFLILFFYCTQSERVDNTGNRYAAKQIAAYPFNTSVSALTFVDRTRMISAGDNGDLKIWKTNTRELLSTFTHTTAATGAHIVVSSACMASPTQLVCSLSNSSSLRVWDLTTSSAPVQTTLSSALSDAPPYRRVCVASPSVIFACFAHGIDTLDLRQPNALASRVISITTLPVISMDCYGTHMLAALTAEQVHLYDARTPRAALATLACSPSQSINTCVLLRTDFVATGDTAGAVRAWRTADFAAYAHVTNTHTAAVSALAPLGPTSPSMFLSSSADGTMQLWQKSTADSLLHAHVFRAHTRPITALAAGELHVASGSADGIAILWEYQQNRFVKPFSSIDA